MIDRVSTGRVVANGTGTAPLRFIALFARYQKTLLGIGVAIVAANLLSLAFPWGLKVIIDESIPAGESRRLYQIGALLALAAVGRGAANWLRSFLSSMVGERIVCDVRATVYAYAQRLSLRSLQTISPPQMTTRLTTDIETIRRFLFDDIIECVYALASMICLFSVMAMMNLRLAGIALVALPVCSIFYVRLLPSLEKGFFRLRERAGLLSSRITEVMEGMAVVKTFTAHEREVSRCQQSHQEILSEASRTYRINAWLWVVVDVISSCAIIVLLCVGSRDVIAGTMSAGALVAFYAYCGMLFSPVIRVAVITPSYQDASAALARLNEVLACAPEIPTGFTGKRVSRLAGNISFEHVSYRYRADTPVIADVCFSVPAGKTVALVGTSGAGKTTLVNLAAGLLLPQSGVIRVDGDVLTGLDMMSYRQRIAVVLQDDFLFSGSMWDNISYGVGAVSAEEIRTAAQRACVEDFIQQVPGGYQYDVGYRGTNLSRGQRQRVAIARALLRKPDILILDEATSSLDALTENQIQQNIMRAHGTQTVIIVAHRFSTIMDADLIVVLEKGRVVAIGRHDELVAQNGIYRTLYQEQFHTGQGSRAR